MLIHKLLFVSIWHYILLQVISRWTPSVVSRQTDRQTDSMYGQYIDRHTDRQTNIYTDT